MPAHFELFNTFITKYVEFTQDELASFNNQCSKVAFTKGTYIMKAGEVQKNLYFLTKGLIRNYIENDNGEIKIYNFRSENMTVTGYAYYNYEDNLKPGDLVLNIENPKTYLDEYMNKRYFIYIKENKETNLHTEASLWGLVNQVYRLCEYLREVTQGHRFASDLESREKDFKSFYSQYDMRRGKNFIETFPELEEWYTSINATKIDNIIEIQQAADNGVYNKEYMDKAMADSVVNNALENEILEYLEPKKLI